MNELSMWLWVIDVASGAETLFKAIVFISIAVVLAMIVFVPPLVHFEITRTAVKWFATICILAAIASAAAGVAIAIIPSKQTMHLMLASEVGESVINHPETQELYQEVKAVLLERIRDEQEQLAPKGPQ